jgi:outer membrane protein assembly factor BamB
MLEHGDAFAMLAGRMNHISRGKNMTEERIYIGGAGHAFALCRNTGEVLWEPELNPRFFKTGSDFVSLLETMKELFAFSYATLYRIDPKSGEVLMQRKLDKLANKVGVLATDLFVSLSAEIGGDGTGDGGDGGGD